MSISRDEWQDEHPTEAGIYFVSVHPSLRDPAPWVTVPPVFRIRIDKEGRVYQDVGDGDESRIGEGFEAEAIYTIGDWWWSSLQALQVRYVGALEDEEVPADPWVGA